MKQFKTILCTVLLILGGLFVACDGAMRIFDATRNIQYACNATYLLGLLPILLHEGNFYEIFFKPCQH